SSARDPSRSIRAGDRALGTRAENCQLALRERLPRSAPGSGAGSGVAMAEATEQGSKSRVELPPLPADAIPIVPIRNVALFPGVVMPISLGRELSIAAAQEAVRTGHKIALLAQRDASTEKPGAADLYQIGVLATVIRYVTTPEGAH